MRISSIAGCVLTALLIGCTPSSPPLAATGSTTPNATASKSAVPAPPAVKGAAPDQNSPPAGSVAAAAQPPATAAASAITLSRGTALAQTLVEGTTVLVSMEYEWTSGGPQPGVEYLWVVDTGKSRRLTGRADVSKPSGTIEIILHGVRPDEGASQGAVFMKESADSPPKQIADFIGFR